MAVSNVDNYSLISSPQNPKLKAAIGLRDSRDRRKSGLFLIDGLELIQKAILGGFQLQQLFLTEDVPSSQVERVLPKIDCEIYRVSTGPMGKLQYGERTVDAIAVARSKPVELAMLTKRLAAHQEPLGNDGRGQVPFSSKTFLVLDRMEKPGNLGAALRTADATRVQAVLLSDPICDLWNPNAVRSSLGALFTVPIAVGTEVEITDWLTNRGVAIYTARVEGSVHYAEVDYKREHAIVIGNEAQGLENRWRSGREQAVAIPMMGVIDSLNASVSTAVLAYESLRQQRIQ